MQSEEDLRTFAFQQSTRAFQHRILRALDVDLEKIRVRDRACGGEFIQADRGYQVARIVRDLAGEIIGARLEPDQMGTCRHGRLDNAHVLDPIECDMPEQLLHIGGERFDRHD